MTERFDIDAFEERAAIREFCGGATRFEAETKAAQDQGVARWQALQFVKEASNANGSGHSFGGGHPAAEMAGQRGTDDLPAMQRRSDKEDRPLPEHHAQAGRAGVELLALQLHGRGVL